MMDAITPRTSEMMLSILATFLFLWPPCMSPEIIRMNWYNNENGSHLQTENFGKFVIGDIPYLDQSFVWPAQRKW